MKRPLIFAVVLVLSATGAWADHSASDCNQDDDVDVRIRGCTQVIEQSQANIAIAYHNRGVAHWRNFDDELAIADYTEAIAIDPNYSEAYSSRGLVYGLSGDKEQAIADFLMVLEIDPLNTLAPVRMALIQMMP